MLAQHSIYCGNERVIRLFKGFEQTYHALVCTKYTEKNTTLYIQQYTALYSSVSTLNYYVDDIT